VKPEDLEQLQRLGIEIDSGMLYGASEDDLIDYTREKIQRVIDDVERSAKEYVTLGEDAISSIIATALNSTMGLVAVREPNSRGHVDIKITAPLYIAEYKFTYLGEAKIWSTKAYCVDGFEQLMSYITGKQKGSFTIIYFRIQECDDQFKAYVEDLLLNKGGSKLKLNGRYGQTRHTHQSTAQVEIDHFAVHLPK
jgi:hypothetical protein